MPWKSRFPGDYPTLGNYAARWIEDNLAMPDRTDYVPLVLTREQVEFLQKFYRLDPQTGKRVVRRGVLSRARGWGKSPFVAAIALLEGLAEIYPDGWDAEGQPVGKPWLSVRTPRIQIAAVSEGQVMTNTWSALAEMIDPDKEPPVYGNYWGLELKSNWAVLPVGTVETITASAATVKGARAILSIWDQTEEWTKSNGGFRLRRILADNAAKVGGAYIETPNAFVPGEGSVAEESAASYQAIVEGRQRGDGRRLLYDHREAPAETDLTDRESLLHGLRVAYGDSSGDPRGCLIHDPPCDPGWAEHDDHIGRIWDADADENASRANFLGQVTHASDSWVSQPEWKERKNETEVKPRQTIVLGFDGSRGRARGKPDATALVGCRVSDGHLFQIEIWEAGDKREQWAEWEPPLVEIEAAIADTFKRYRVVAFYCDPARDWRSYVNKWEAKWGARIPRELRCSSGHPFEWWMVGGRSSKVELAVQSLEAAIRNKDMTHDGSYFLTKHVLNARRRLRHGKLVIDKASPGSTKKIDGAIAAVLAWQARLDAITAGYGKTVTKQRIQRVR